jgi:hypothetical protein
MKSELLKALEAAKSGNWDLSHDLVQDLHGKLPYWIHANLHKEEGDRSNALYWYRKVGENHIELTLKEERNLILSEIQKLPD